MKAPLLWQQGGVYVPVVHCGVLVEWRRDETGNPLFGIQVDSIENARRFAAVKEMFRLEEKVQ